jgi:hypothetical protein
MTVSSRLHLDQCIVGGLHLVDRTFSVERGHIPTIGEVMELSNILAELDDEIAKLKQARSLLAGGTGRLPGRPKAEASPSAPPRMRKLTPEGRKRIAEAVKRRWAAQKKAAGK